MNENVTIKSFLKNFGFLGLFIFFTYPIYAVFSNVPVFITTTKNILSVIISGQWDRYYRLSAYRTLNSSWHRGYDQYLEKFTNKGYNTDIGLGKPMISIFQITKVSMAIYRKYELFTPILGMLGFLFTFTIYHDHTNGLQLMIVLTLLIFSSLFYFSTFEAIKYDALGWLFTPAFIYFLENGHLEIASLFLIIISFMSLSVLLPLFFITIIYAVFKEVKIVFVTIPAAIKFLSHFYFIFKNPVDLIAMLVGIGSIKREEKKKFRTLKLGPDGIYLILLWILFPAFIWIFENNIFYTTLSLCCVFLYFINKKVIRFGDSQTFYNLTLTLFSISLIQCWNPILLIPYIIALNPSPLILTFAGDNRFSKKSFLFRLPTRIPFDIKSFRERISPIIDPIGEKERVAFYYDYNFDVFTEFNGYRALKEYLQLELNKKSCILFPDYYLIFDNAAGKFPLDKYTGDSKDQTLFNIMKGIGANYALIPQVNDSLEENLKSHLITVNKIYLPNLFSEKKDCGIQVYEKEKPWLFLCRSKKQNSIVQKGIINSSKPNKLCVTTNSEGICIVKILFDTGWKCLQNKKITISKEEDFGWLKVEGVKNEKVILDYIV